MRAVAIGAVRAYQRTVGLAFPGRCKYYPSCSHYAIDAFRAHGLLRGLVLTGWRLLRCNPWARGGFDHVHDQRLFRSRP